MNCSHHLWKAIKELARKGDMWCRLVVAEHEGKGIRFSADEVSRLVVFDEALVSAAESAAEELLDRRAKEEAP